MRHVLTALSVPLLVLTALSVPLLVLACNGRILPGTTPGSGGQDLSNTNAGSSGCSGATGCPADAGLSEACSAADGTLLSFPTADDILTALRGRWLTCSSGPFDFQPDDAVGIEFDGSVAFFLVQGPNGTAVRGNGPSYARKVDIIDTLSFNGSGANRYALNLTQGNGTSTSTVDLFGGPQKLVLSDYFERAEYVPAPGPNTDDGDSGYDGGLWDYGYDGGDLYVDGGWVVPMPGSSDDGSVAPYDGGSGYSGDDASARSCSIVGTWDVTSNLPYGSSSSFEFFSDGTFVGGPRLAALPAGQAFSGDWSIGPDGELSIFNTVGMYCNAGTTKLSLMFDGPCETVTLQVQTDACTGGREQVDDTTVMQER